MPYRTQQTRAPRRAAVPRPGRVATPQPAGARRVDFTERLRTLPQLLERQDSSFDCLRTWQKVACSPLDPERIARAIVAACGRWMPGSGWAIFGDEWVVGLRPLASYRLDAAGLASARVLALRVFRSGEDVAVGSLAAEGTGRRDVAGVGFGLGVRGSSLALVGLHRGGVSARFAVPRPARVALLRALMLPALALDMAQRLAKAERLSVTDDLTQLYNARYLAQVLRREAKRSIRTRLPLSLLFLDLDGFKRVNDAHGHLAGSRALVETGQVLRESARESDMVARYGGDEFAVVLPETDPAGARFVAERIRDRIARRVFLEGEGLAVRLTISVGLASMPANASTADELIRAADEAMYWIKGRGKDGVHGAAARTGRAPRR